MIIVDKAPARFEAGNPVKVGMIGAGFMGRGIANQIINRCRDGTGISQSELELSEPMLKLALRMFMLSRLS